MADQITGGALSTLVRRGLEKRYQPKPGVAFSAPTFTRIMNADAERLQTLASAANFDAMAERSRQEMEHMRRQDEIAEERRSALEAYYNIYPELEKFASPLPMRNYTEVTRTPPSPLEVLSRFPATVHNRTSDWEARRAAYIAGESQINETPIELGGQFFVDPAQVDEYAATQGWDQNQTRAQLSAARQSNRNALTTMTDDIFDRLAKGGEIAGVQLPERFLMNLTEPQRRSLIRSVLRRAIPADVNVNELFGWEDKDFNNWIEEKMARYPEYFPSTQGEGNMVYNDDTIDPRVLGGS